MRVIKFRGKTSRGNWLYGYYSKNLNGDAFILCDKGEFVVEEETVGQFTGLLDNADKEIYEGDIVYCECEWFTSSEDNIFPPEKKWKIGKITGEVIWNQDDLQFEIKRPSGKLKLLSNNTIPLAYFSKAWNRSNDSIVVIGNINDNPELI